MHFRRSLFALSLIAAATPAAAQQAALIDRIGWLAGCWELRAPNRVVMEMWMPPMGGAMLGSSRTVVGGVTREFEHLRISTRGDTLVYTAIPSGQKETDFKTTATATEPIAFENRAHDFPQVVSYRRAGADSIVARIEGPAPNGTTRGTNFPMKRTSCTTPPAPIAPPDTLTLDAELSRDAKQLLFVKTVGANADIYLMNLEAGSVRPLTSDAVVEYQPTWSPNGSLIAFVSVKDGHQEIYTMRPDGSALTQLTRGSAHNSEPAWSPDGRSIAFRSERDRRPHVYLMDADGSNQRDLTPDSLGGNSPSWSPDGKRIAYVSGRTGKPQIHVMNADGSAKRALTNAPQGVAIAPAWSPDGTRIAFTSTADGNGEVYVMNADGSNLVNLSRNPAPESVLGWSADSAYVLFRSGRDRAGNDIYRMKADGTGVTRLTITK